MSNIYPIHKFWRTFITASAMTLTAIVLPACEVKSTMQTAKDLGLTNESHLRSVSFVDQKHGWAVGIYGLIIATDDGGSHWQLQHGGTKYTLDSVHFVDTEHGWAVGQFTEILATEDGGKHWVQQDSPTAGDFNSVYFADKLHGWVSGDNGVILNTLDGGKHWLQQSALTQHGLGGVSFTDPQNGWVVGGPFIGATSDGGMHWRKQADIADLSLWKVHFINSKQGSAVGDNGEIFATKDGGEHWEKQQSTTSATLLGIDYANTQMGWVVGSEGTVLSTADAGVSWKAQKSGTGVYLSGVSFVDAQHGWIVGDSATVLATADGGMTWQTQLSVKPQEKVESQGKPSGFARHDLTIVGYNYTSRYITQFDVDGEPGGDVHVSSESNGGGGMTCCMPYVAGGPAWVAKIRWDAKACTFDTRIVAGEKFNTIHHFFKEADVQVDKKVPSNPKYLEVHFYPDGHVEAAMTEVLSSPRMPLSENREDRSEFPNCPNDKEPHE